MFYNETIKETCQKTHKNGYKKFFAACLAGLVFGIFSGVALYSLCWQNGMGNFVYSTDYVVSIETSNDNPYGLLSDHSPDGYASGIIFYETGDKVFAVTNYHAVENAVNISVHIGASPSVSAVLAGYDADMDLAVIFMRKDELFDVGVYNISVARFADSDALRVGETVLAIGNAKGQGSVMTRGIISATEKIVANGERTSVFLQTDAAINVGSSGGALLNANGEVVGITTAKMRYRDGNSRTLDGIGFCIPSNLAKTTIESIMNEDKKPFLGIAALNETLDDGVLVRAVVPRSSAANGGVRRGDLITAFNNEALHSMDMLEEKIAAYNIGDQIELTVIRDDKVISVTIILE